jgi:hypothetical protein
MRRFTRKPRKPCALGATIADLADAFDVAPSTIWEWKLNHPAFFESCRVGLESANDRVEHSMYKRAVGYTHEAAKVFMLQAKQASSSVSLLIKKKRASFSITLRPTSSDQRSSSN